MKKCKDCIHNKKDGKHYYCEACGTFNDMYQDNCNGCDYFEPKYKHKKELK